MDNGENTLPMDVTDPSSRPWKFRPRGYLVVILASSEEAQRAETALVKVPTGSVWSPAQSVEGRRSSRSVFAGHVWKVAR